MRRFFIPPNQIGQQHAVLTHADAHHAHTVLRLGRGDRIEIFDGTGKQYEAQIVRSDADEVHLLIVNSLPENPDGSLELAFAQGYLKDKKMDLLIRQLTELGAARWIPFTARRSVALPPAARLTNRLQRWEKISLEAVKQCKRSRPMHIENVVSFEEALNFSTAYDLKLIFYEKENLPGDWESLQKRDPHRVFVMVGPEGGFEDHEVAAARRAGFHTLGMGPRILRAETAALAACTMVQMVFGDMGYIAAGGQKSP